MQQDLITSDSNKNSQFNLGIHSDDIYGAERSAGWGNVTAAEDSQSAAAAAN